MASATAASGYEIVELVRGAPLHLAGGAYAGPDGHLYVASIFGGEIVVLDVDSGEIVGRLGPDDGVLGPDDLAFGPDGSLYWTDMLVGEVGRRTPDGAVTKQFVAPGVASITFADDGRLFVALNGMGDGLLELDPDLLAPPRSIVVASEETPYPLGFFNAFEFGPDGRLYGPLLMAGMVIGFDVDSCEGTSSPWDDCDVRVLASGFHSPVAAKFDPHGVLHVLEADTGEVFALDVETGDRTVVAVVDEGLDNFAFDASGRMFVTNATDGSVTEVLAGGLLRVVSPGGLIAPCGVAVLERPGGGASVFVADVIRLWEYDAVTGALIGFTKGDMTGQRLLRPTAAWADGPRLVLTSWTVGGVQVVDPWSGEVLERYAAGFPYEAVRVGADLAMVDLMAGGVVWASTGEPILPMDDQRVFLPVGLATDGELLWVSDWATGMVWQVAFDDTDPLPIAFEMANPEGLAFDGEGGLLVVESGAGRLSRIDLATGGVEEIATGLELGLPAIAGIPPAYLPNGVAVDASGAIYVTGDVGNVLYRITRR
ncbi:MAG: SMP-30/gluconolactonase/LRE family protein [Trueperaceae bacterium]|nr:SMP-30/gluconolactonase/LRE family protein [Trueperaceae bacterium]